MHPRAHCRKVNWSHFPSFSENDRLYAAEKARALSVSIFGKKIYSRGLVEISNYCRNDCYYCGIRKSNCNAVRYRLSGRTSFTAATGDMRQASGPLSFRAAKTAITQTTFL